MDGSANNLKLPIGIQGFVEMRTGGYAYVDKTRYIEELTASGKHFVLSRPRRFGKSLFVDTLDCAFSGRRELFAGLYLADHWDWFQKHPVLRIDLSDGAGGEPEALKEILFGYIRRWMKDYGISAEMPTPGRGLMNIIPEIEKAANARVVVLVDEYDKPILDTINSPEIAAKMRDILKDFYGSLKPLDPHLEFVFLTGVSKFAKAGIFSGLNNLIDLTLSKPFSAICGYSQNELEAVFAPWLEDFDTEEIKAWYNGYSWGGESVYNPFDVLLLFREKEYRSFWFETGTPAFLVKLLSDQPRMIPDLDNLAADEDIVGSFDVDRIRPETMLFQAGYLTVKSSGSSAEQGMRYLLGFPNRKVRQSFSRFMLELFGIEGGAEISRRDSLLAAMTIGDTDALRVQLHALFASIPYNWYVNNPIARYEGFYASVVYAWFASVGWEVVPEDTTNKGRVDLTVKTRTSIWLFEFKVRGFNTGYAVVPEEKSPLAQLVERGYAEKYRADGRPVRLVGIVFDPASRQVVGWEPGA